MKILIFDNYGNGIEEREINHPIQAEDFIQIKGKLFQVWRLFHFQDGAVGVQIRSSPYSGSQNPKYY